MDHGQNQSRSEKREIDRRGQQLHNRTICPNFHLRRAPALLLEYMLALRGRLDGLNGSTGTGGQRVVRREVAEGWLVQLHTSTDSTLWVRGEV